MCGKILILRIQRSLKIEQMKLQGIHVEDEDDIEEAEILKEMQQF